jgi:Rab-like protein 3
MDQKVKPTRSVRILVLGDSGVGKTCLVHRLCYGDELKDPAWTVGCNTAVKLDVREHETLSYQFLDIGGHNRYAISREVFYYDICGIILVFDHSNRKSYKNLRSWISEIVSAQDKRNIVRHSGDLSFAHKVNTY